MMKSSSVYMLLFAVLVLCGSAWGKAVVQSVDKGEVDDAPPMNSPCRYQGSIVTIDVTKIASRFNGQNITSLDGRYVYFLSLCSPAACSFNQTVSEEDKMAAGCQFIKSQDAFVRMGSFTSYKWSLTNTTYFSLTFSDGDPDPNEQKGRRLQVNFKEGDTCSGKPTIRFDGEMTSEDGKYIDYVFTISNIKAHEALSMNDDIELF